MTVVPHPPRDHRPDEAESSPRVGGNGRRRRGVSSSPCVRRCSCGSHRPSSPSPSPEPPTAVTRPNSPSPIPMEQPAAASAEAARGAAAWGCHRTTGPAVVRRCSSETRAAASQALRPCCFGCLRSEMCARSERRLTILPATGGTASSRHGLGTGGCCCCCCCAAAAAAAAAAAPAVPGRPPQCCCCCCLLHGKQKQEKPSSMTYSYKPLRGRR